MHVEDMLTEEACAHAAPVKSEESWGGFDFQLLIDNTDLKRPQKERGPGQGCVRHPGRQS